MITLRVREKGHLIQIPGLADFRTPADIDVTKIEIRKVIGHLKVCGITDYEIVAINPKGEKEIYNEKDFTIEKKKKKKKEDLYKKEIDSRFDKLEKLILNLLGNKENIRNEDINKEQITEKLERLEKISEAILSKQKNSEGLVYKDTKKKFKIDDEDNNLAFIPEVEIGDLKIKSSSVKSVQDQREDINDAADSLSKFLGGKK